MHGKVTAKTDAVLVRHRNTHALNTRLKGLGLLLSRYLSQAGLGLSKAAFQGASKYNIPIVNESILFEIVSSCVTVVDGTPEGNSTA